MIKIRLARGGSKGSHFFRLVAIDKRRKRGGKPLDIIGFWQKDKNTKKINKEKVSLWVRGGAQITKAAEKLIKS